METVAPLQESALSEHARWNSCVRKCLALFQRNYGRLMNSVDWLTRFWGRHMQQLQGNRGIFDWAALRGIIDWAALLICCQNSQWLEQASCCCWAGASSCLQSSVGLGQMCACSYAMTHHHH